jgi:hypothetical protein
MVAQSSCVSPDELSDGRGGLARSQIIRQRGSLALYKTLNVRNGDRGRVERHVPVVRRGGIEGEYNIEKFKDEGEQVIGTYRRVRGRSDEGKNNYSELYVMRKK